MKRVSSLAVLTIDRIEYEIVLQPKANGFAYAVRKVWSGTTVVSGWTAGTRHEANAEAEDHLRKHLAKE